MICGSTMRITSKVALFLVLGLAMVASSFAGECPSPARPSAAVAWP
jgi:hypothetical protein